MTVLLLLDIGMKSFELVYPCDVAADVDIVILSLAFTVVTLAQPALKLL